MQLGLLEFEIEEPVPGLAVHRLCTNNTVIVIFDLDGTLGVSEKFQNYIITELNSRKEHY